MKKRAAPALSAANEKPFASALARYRSPLRSE
jgi:hypothetical protein